MTDDRPTFGSLFAGIGGIDLGLERAGWRGRWQVEYEPFCQRVLARHWPDVIRYGDIRDVDWSTVDRVDLVAGGFPCQPFSNAGKRLGKDDVRWLWPEFARAVGALRPRYVLVENVPGLLAGHGEMGAVLGDLAALGYDAEWDSIPASAVGAPHLRYRVWIVAHTDRVGPGRQAEVGPPCVTGSRPEGAGAEPDGADPGAAAMADADGRRLGWADPPDEVHRSAVHGNGTARDVAGSSGGALADADPSGRDGRSREYRTGWRTEPTNGGLGDADGEGLPQSGDAGAAGTSASGVLSRPTTDRTGWWATEPDVGRVAHGVPARVDRLRALGNAVVPQVVQFIGERILESERRNVSDAS